MFFFLVVFKQKEKVDGTNRKPFVILHRYEYAQHVGKEPYNVV